MEVSDNHQKYAALRIYFGLTSCRGLPEMRLDRANEYCQGYIPNAMKYAREAIEAARQGRTFPDHNIGFNKLVKDVNEADNLMEFLKKELSAKEGIELHDVIHGSLRFFRIARLYNLGIEDKDKIVTIISDSNIGKFKKMAVPFEEKMRQAEITTIWDEHLKFYT